MVSTGLKDTNGKEIYEGDICRESYYKSRFIEGDSGWRALYEGFKGRWIHTKMQEEFVVKDKNVLLERIAELIETTEEEDIEKLKSGGFFEVIRRGI